MKPAVCSASAAIACTNGKHVWPGHCHALSLKGRPSARRKIKDLAAFREFVLAHPDKTQAEMAQLWGEGVNQQLVSRVLKQLAITRKKNSGATVNETKASGSSTESR